MYLTVTDKRTRARFFFAGYDPSVKGLCRWSQSMLQAVNIADVNIIEKLKRFLTINSIFDYTTHRFGVIDEEHIY